jgi:hypothetical protein
MTEADIEVILERAKELYPEAKPPIISDTGPRFIASWRRPENSAGFVVRRLREERRATFTTRG